MRLNVIALALALATVAHATETKVSNTHQIAAPVVVAEGPGPDVPPIVIRAGQERMMLAEGPGPDVPPIVIKIMRMMLAEGPGPDVPPIVIRHGQLAGPSFVRNA